LFAPNTDRVCGFYSSLPRTCITSARDKDAHGREIFQVAGTRGCHMMALVAKGASVSVPAAAILKEWMRGSRTSERRWGCVRIAGMRSGWNRTAGRFSGGVDCRPVIRGFQNIRGCRFGSAAGMSRRIGRRLEIEGRLCRGGLIPSHVELLEHRVSAGRSRSRDLVPGAACWTARGTRMMLRSSFPDRDYDAPALRWKQKAERNSGLPGPDALRLPGNR
jgi:hypothetical protein